MRELEIQQVSFHNDGEKYPAVLDVKPLTEQEKQEHVMQVVVEPESVTQPDTVINTSVNINPCLKFLCIFVPFIIHILIVRWTILGSVYLSDEYSLYTTNFTEPDNSGCNTMWSLLAYYTYATLIWILPVCFLNFTFIWYINRAGHKTLYMICKCTLVLCVVSTAVGIILLHTVVNNDNKCVEIFEYNQSEWLNTALTSKTQVGNLLIGYFRMYYILGAVYLTLAIGIPCGLFIGRPFAYRTWVHFININVFVAFIVNIAYFM